MSGVYETYVIERYRRKFRVEYVYDDIHRRPWEDSDGYGVVEEFYARHSRRYNGKRPWQVLMPNSSGEAYWAYDWRASTQKAKRQGWGISDDERAALTKELGRPPTHKEAIRRAVEQDFEHHAGWLRDEWRYVGVRVVLLDADEDPIEDIEVSTWGLESKDEDYLRDEAFSLAATAWHEAKRRWRDELAAARKRRARSRPA